MGGVINVAIRFRDGTAICQERWTNNTPFWFKDPKMYVGDEEHVRAFVAMTRNNDYIADPHALGKPQPIEPSEYGLIVWDYVTNTILDNNDYSDPVSFDAELAMSETSGEKRDLFLANAKEGRLRVRTIHFEPRAEGDNNPSRIASETLSDHLSEEEAIRIATDANARWRAWSRSDGLRSREEGYISFIVDPRPMTYVAMPRVGLLTDDEGEEILDDKGRVQRDSKAWGVWLAKLKEIGFPMTEAEGLNATLPKVPDAREITPEEKVSREMFYEYKRTEPGKRFDGVRFEDAPEDVKAHMLRAGTKLALNKEARRAYDLAQLLGGSETLDQLFEITAQG